jgi:tripeptidyl-peptidase-1
LLNGLNLICSADPTSPNFGKHWTPEEVIEAFRPSAETELAVLDWLVSSGISAKRVTHSENKSWFAFYATAEEAESLLHTEFHEFEDSITGGVMPSCDSYSIPKHVREHIDYITPGVKLLAPVESYKSKREMTLAKVNLEKKDLESRIQHSVHNTQSVSKPSNPNDLSTCDEAVTPACVAALYGIPVATTCHPDNSLGIFESELQFYHQVDLDSFFTTFQTAIKNGTHPIAANIDGGMQSTNDLGYTAPEVALDLQLAYPIIYPQTITLYNVDDFIVQSNPNDTYTFGFNTFLDALDGVSEFKLHESYFN